MTKEFVIYCDESTQEGKYYSNFYGGALVRSGDVDYVRRKLREKKVQLRFDGEIKWSKVTENYLKKYKRMIDKFFKLVRNDKIKVRIMFSHNRHPARNLTKRQVSSGYFLLYYQFIKHAFGLVHSNDGTSPIRVRIFFDQMPDTKESVELFKAYITRLSKNPKFRAARIVINAEDLSDAVSHDHDILQCLDIVLGAMQFRLNEMHKAVPKGARKRGKRTRAKEELYKHINTRIREIYPNFNIGITTGMQNGVSDRWLHPYRHWCFLPKDRGFDPSIKK
jgi:hypothetical protein